MDLDLVHCAHEQGFLCYCQLDYFVLQLLDLVFLELAAILVVELLAVLPHCN